jgi:hypothetical protein
MFFAQYTLSAFNTDSFTMKFVHIVNIWDFELKLFHGILMDTILYSFFKKSIIDAFNGSIPIILDIYNIPNKTRNLIMLVKDII